jgi:pseudouridine-5'-phosphate glycosidase
VLEPVIERALTDAVEGDLAAAEVTPFLLRRLRDIKGERIVEANRALLRRNAALAAEIAQALD